MDEPEREFREFVAARWRPLVSTAFLVTGDVGLAEDCVQEALVRVHRRWAKLHREGNPEAYTRRAVINAALSWRRRRRIAEVPLDSTPDRAGLPADESLDLELVRALRSLPPAMRAAVVLRYVEDCSEIETARLLGCSVGTVKSNSQPLGPRSRPWPQTARSSRQRRSSGPPAPDYEWREFLDLVR